MQIHKTDKIDKIRFIRLIHKIDKIDKIFWSDKVKIKSIKVVSNQCISRFFGVIKSIKVVFTFFFSSILIEEARTKISYFFLKCTLKKRKQEKQSHYSFKPVPIFSTFKDIKKQAAGLSNITNLLFFTFYAFSFF